MKHTSASYLSFIHLLKLTGIQLIFIICLIPFSWFLPSWLLVIAYFGFFSFVFLPLFFGFGEQGKEFSKELHEAMKAEKEEKNKSDKI